MNWLAHVYLSRPEVDFRLGNLLADVKKGQSWPGTSLAFAEGERCHYAIDAFTDAHPLVHRSIRRLGSTGLLRGIAIDLIYDHYLSLHWQTFARSPLREFLESFYRDLPGRDSRLPEAAEAFLTALVRSDRLGNYQAPEAVLGAMYRTDSRLSSRARSRGAIASFYPAFLKDYSQLEKDFLDFFPELIASIDQQWNVSDQF
ncbi:MAG: ACP phosphodiesterase [Opitutales bacterium]